VTAKDLGQRHPSIQRKDILHVKTAEALSHQHPLLFQSTETQTYGLGGSSVRRHY
jgi:hypothetical protein